MYAIRSYYVLYNAPGQLGLNGPKTAQTANQYKKTFLTKEQNNGHIDNSHERRAGKN